MPLARPLKRVHLEGANRRPGRSQLHVIQIPDFDGPATADSHGDGSAVGLKATLFTMPTTTGMVPTRLPVAVSQTPTVRSAEPVSTRLPSGLKAIDSILARCPTKVRSLFPERASHSTAISPQEAEHVLAIGTEDRIL